MLIDNLKEVWGVPLDMAVEYGRMRRILLNMTLFLMVSIIWTVVQIMQVEEVSFGDYGTTMLLIAVFFYAAHYLFTRSRFYRVYRFYLSKRRYYVQKQIVRLTPTGLNDFLYGVNRISLGDNLPISKYLEDAYETCLYELGFVSKFAEFLRKAADNEDGELYTVYYIEQSNGKRYVLQVEALVTTEEQEKETEQSDETEGIEEEPESLDSDK